MLLHYIYSTSYISLHLLVLFLETTCDTTLQLFFFFQVQQHTRLLMLPHIMCVSGIFVLHVSEQKHGQTFQQVITREQRIPRSTLIQIYFLLFFQNHMLLASLFNLSLIHILLHVVIVLRYHDLVPC